MCIHTHIYIYIYTYIHICIYIHICNLCVCISMRVHVCVHVWVCVIVTSTYKRDDFCSGAKIYWLIFWSLLLRGNIFAWFCQKITHSETFALGFYLEISACGLIEKVNRLKKHLYGAEIYQFIFWCLRRASTWKYRRVILSSKRRRWLVVFF